MRRGDYRVTLTFQGYARSFDLHVPPHYDGKTPLPLVIALHAFGGDAASFENFIGFSKEADVEGFFVVYPQGLNGSWNAGICCRPSSQQIFDDAGFIQTVLVKLKSDVAVNDSRVYVVGESNGGMLAYRLACNFPEDFAAIAAVSATSVVTECCNATSPVSVMAVHGTADQDIPYNESTRSKSDLPVPPAVDAISFGHSTTGPFPCHDSRWTQPDSNHLCRGLKRHGSGPLYGQRWDIWMALGNSDY
jgi:polyhydroxybutyrate depolymerase